VGYYLATAGFAFFISWQPYRHAALAGTNGACAPALFSLLAGPDSYNHPFSWGVGGRYLTWRAATSPRLLIAVHLFD